MCSGEQRSLQAGAVQDICTSSSNSLLTLVGTASLGYVLCRGGGHTEACTCLLLSQSASLSVSQFAHICQSRSFFLLASPLQQLPLLSRLSCFPLLHCSRVVNGRWRTGTSPSIINSECFLSFSPS